MEEMPSSWWDQRSGFQKCFFTFFSIFVLLGIACCSINAYVLKEQGVPELTQSIEKTNTSRVQRGVSLESKINADHFNEKVDKEMMIDGKGVDGVLVDGTVPVQSRTHPYSPAALRPGSPRSGSASRSGSSGSNFPSGDSGSGSDLGYDSKSRSGGSPPNSGSDFPSGESWSRGGSPPNSGSDIPSGESWSSDGSGSIPSSGDSRSENSGSDISSGSDKGSGSDGDRWSDSQGSRSSESGSGSYSSESGSFKSNSRSKESGSFESDSRSKGSFESGSSERGSSEIDPNSQSDSEARRPPIFIDYNRRGKPDSESDSRSDFESGSSEIGSSENDPNSQSDSEARRPPIFIDYNRRGKSGSESDSRSRGGFESGPSVFESAESDQNSQSESGEPIRQPVFIDFNRRGEPGSDASLMKPNSEETIPASSFHGNTIERGEDAIFNKFQHESRSVVDFKNALKSRFVGYPNFYGLWEKSTPSGGVYPRKRFIRQADDFNDIPAPLFMDKVLKKLSAVHGEKIDASKLNQPLYERNFRLQFANAMPQDGSSTQSSVMPSSWETTTSDWMFSGGTDESSTPFMSTTGTGRSSTHSMPTTEGEMSVSPDTSMFESSTSAPYYTQTSSAPTTKKMSSARYETLPASKTYSEKYSTTPRTATTKCVPKTTASGESGFESSDCDCLCEEISDFECDDDMCKLREKYAKVADDVIRDAKFVSSEPIGV